MGHLYYQLDVAHALAAHLLFSHLHTTAVADDTLVTDTLVLAAMALEILDRTENLLTEQAIALGLVGAVVDGFGLEHLTARLLLDFLGRSKTDGDFGEIALYLVVSSKSHSWIMIFEVGEEKLSVATCLYKMTCRQLQL